jgi:hypothetical protein
MWLQNVDNNFKNFEKNFNFLVAILKVTDENSKIRSRIRRYGSADPDPYQNVTDPQHWQMLCTVASCYCLYALLLFYTPEAVLIERGGGGVNMGELCG